MANLYDELAAHRDNNNDKRVFGLVLQGGGMRAVYSAASIAPLIEYGFTNTFEHVIGSSAGAINGAYFLSADAEMMKTYTDDLSNKNFIDLLRPENKVNIDYLVDTALKNNRPINTKKLLDTHSKLHTVVTDAKTGKKVVISDHKKFVEIYEEFRATAALPFLYSKSVLVQGSWYIDGGISDLIPVDVAIKLGCSDILVVMTQRINSYTLDKKHKRLVKHLMKKFARQQSEAVRKKLPTDEKILRANIRTLSHPTKKVRIYVVEPSNEEFLVSRITIDREQLERLARMGISDMDTFIHKPL